MENYELIQKEGIVPSLVELRVKTSWKNTQQIWDILYIRLGLYIHLRKGVHTECPKFTIFSSIQTLIKLRLSL